MLFLAFVRYQQNHRQKVTLRLCRGIDIPKFDKNSLIYSISHFNLGGLGALCGEG